jgi:transposase
MVSRAGVATVFAELDELKPANLTADKAFDPNAILQQLESTGTQAVIPSRANRLEQRALDEQLYASRNLVERFFRRIRQLRWIATRYDKLSERVSSFVMLNDYLAGECAHLKSSHHFKVVPELLHG